VKVDLHTHTTASDGQYPPAEVVAKAKEAGIVCLAITDHDTIQGLEEAVRTGETLEITVLRGIELGAAEDRNLHILGYGFSPDAPGLRKLCQVLKDSRDERKYRIVRFLKEKGMDISLAEVEELAGGKIIARPHFAQIMVRRGYVASTREAFDRYLDTDEYQKIERFKADARQCIAVIQQAGGRAVLAHPWQLRYSDDALETLVVRLKELGLAGIECYYPRHTPEQIQFYLSLARKYDLHITAGSDFHGEKVKPDVQLTPVELDVSWLLASMN